MNPTATNFSDLTDEEVAAKLSGESLKGPRTFRGRQLAPWTAGSRDLVLKVITRGDTAIFHDCVVLFILCELHALTPEDKLARRRAMIVATDDADAFRARVSIELYDDLSDAEILEGRRVVNEVLAPVAAAQVAVKAMPGKAKKAAGSRPTKTR